MVRYDEKTGARITVPKGHRLLQQDVNASQKGISVSLSFGSPRLGQARARSVYDFMSFTDESYAEAAARRDATIEAEMKDSVEIVMDFGDYDDFIKTITAFGR